MLPDQQARLDEWLPGHVVVRDHTWGLVDRDVVEVSHEGAAYLVKAGGPSDGHMAREIRAHGSCRGGSSTAIPPPTTRRPTTRRASCWRCSTTSPVTTTPASSAARTPGAVAGSTVRTASLPTSYAACGPSWRPAATDLLRLSSRELRGDPTLEAAFLDGYGMLAAALADLRVSAPAPR
jgi:hypothetical protein